MRSDLIDMLNKISVQVNCWDDREKALDMFDKVLDENKRLKKELKGGKSNSSNILSVCNKNNNA